MTQKQTTIINGREYDMLTGLPVVSPKTSHHTTQKTAAPAARKPHTAAKPSHSMHGKAQRSTTLNRAFVKKQAQKTAAPHTATTPITVATPNTQPAVQRRTRQRIDGMRPLSKGSHARANASIALANAKKKGVQIAPTHITPAVTLAAPAAQVAETPMPHPIVTRAHQKHAAKKTPAVAAAPAPASIIKQAAINEALDNAPKHHAKQHKTSSKRAKFLSLVSGFAALVLFAGYLTYLNVPNLSVRVAAVQAGIDASYPNYQPDGFKLNGPVAFSDGEVRMDFAARAGDGNFTLKQSRSSWDSNALLENYVKEKSNNSYATSQEKGITVYSFGGNAAWVSGGILYTIDGDAGLSPDQIRRIATSV